MNKILPVLLNNMCNRGYADHLPFIVGRFQLMLIIFTFILLNIYSENLASETVGINNYKLRSGDNIQISVYGENELSIEKTISDTGVITYPLLGEIKISGLTISQVKELITEGLKPDFLINPSVLVTVEPSALVSIEQSAQVSVEPSAQVQVKQYRSYFIGGEVKKPGKYPYKSGLNVSEAVVQAGGFTERASRGSIYVIRATDKSEKKIKVSLNDPVYNGDKLNIDESFF